MDGIEEAPSKKDTEQVETNPQADEADSNEEGSGSGDAPSGDEGSNQEEGNDPMDATNDIINDIFASAPAASTAAPAQDDAEEASSSSSSDAPESDHEPEPEPEVEKPKEKKKSKSEKSKTKSSKAANVVIKQGDYVDPEWFEEIVIPQDHEKYPGTTDKTVLRKMLMPKHIVYARLPSGNTEFLIIMADDDRYYVPPFDAITSCYNGLDPRPSNQRRDYRKAASMDPANRISITEKDTGLHKSVAFLPESYIQYKMDVSAKKAEETKNKKQVTPAATPTKPSIKKSSTNSSKKDKEDKEDKMDVSGEDSSSSEESGSGSESGSSSSSSSGSEEGNSASSDDEDEDVFKKKNAKKLQVQKDAAKQPSVKSTPTPPPKSAMPPPTAKPTPTTTAPTDVDAKYKEAMKAVIPSIVPYNTAPQVFNDMKKNFVGATFSQSKSLAEWAPAMAKHILVLQAEAERRGMPMNGPLWQLFLGDRKNDPFFNEPVTFASALHQFANEPKYLLMMRELVFHLTPTTPAPAAAKPTAETPPPNTAKKRSNEEMQASSAGNYIQPPAAKKARVEAPPAKKEESKPDKKKEEKKKEERKEEKKEEKKKEEKKEEKKKDEKRKEEKHKDEKKHKEKAKSSSSSSSKK